MGLRLGHRAGGGALLTVSDAGPGLPGPHAAERGHSGSGSTGLGLDIVRRAAASSGGEVTFGRALAGGAMITMVIGPPPDGAVRRRSRRAR
jgi:signal transduction histidine kinase